MIYLLALVIGIVGGLRAMTAPAAVSWAAYLGWLKLQDSWLAFMGYTWTPWLLTLFAIGELIVDQLPSTPSRTLPAPFITRVVVGALTGGAIGTAAGAPLIGFVLGPIGAVIGTLGGRAARGALAAKFGRDRPAAIIEDIVAIGAAALTVGAFA